MIIPILIFFCRNMFKKSVQNYHNNASILNHAVCILEFELRKIL